MVVEVLTNWTKAATFSLATQSTKVLPDRHTKTVTRLEAVDVEAAIVAL